MSLFECNVSGAFHTWSSCTAIVFLGQLHPGKQKCYLLSSLFNLLGRCVFTCADSATPVQGHSTSFWEKP